MKGHGEKLSRKQGRAIAALLSCSTMVEAARQAEIGEVTLWRWLQVSSFRQAYHAARRQVVEGAIGQMQQATTEAVETLRRNLTSGVPAVEVQAARAIIDQSLKAVELVELAERVGELERVLQHGAAGATEPSAGKGAGHG